MAKSAIEWTESTWNPVTGCTRFSAGCKNCYAARMAKRLQAMGQQNYVHGFKLAMHEHTLGYPLQWKKPRMVFVNSMSDLFHGGVPVRFIKRVFSVMESADWHVFQVLTKRAARLEKLSRALVWPSNVWMGVSVESQMYSERIERLRRTDAAVKFVSFEPLLGPIHEPDLSGIDWVIVGGESGPRARPLCKEWVASLRDICREAGIPFFFKQWGGTNKKKAGRRLDGRTWNEMPVRCAI